MLYFFLFLYLLVYSKHSSHRNPYKIKWILTFFHIKLSNVSSSHSENQSPSNDYEALYDLDVLPLP